MRRSINKQYLKIIIRIPEHLQQSTDVWEFSFFKNLKLTETEMLIFFLNHKVTETEIFVPFILTFLSLRTGTEKIIKVPVPDPS